MVEVLGLRVVQAFLGALGFSGLGCPVKWVWVLESMVL